MLAIGCGISDGLGFGCNGRAALITRGLSEMTRLAVMLGAHPLTMQGLAGMGDLVLTCTGERVYLIDVRARDFGPSSGNCAAPRRQKQVCTGVGPSTAEVPAVSSPFPSLGAGPTSTPALCVAMMPCWAPAGDLSRNRTVGIRLGKGEKLEEIKASMKAVAEGVLTSQSAHQLAKSASCKMPCSAWHPACAVHSHSLLNAQEHIHRNVVVGHTV